MFKLNVDDDINLCLVHECFASRYLELVQENYEYLAEWLHWPRVCKTESSFKDFIRNSLHDYAEGKSINFAIEYQGVIVGNCGFNSINHDLKVVEIGYWIGHQYQGNGIMTRACHYLIEFAFTELNVDKVQIGAAEHNVRSRAVIERLGLTLEGIISNQERVGDRILSHAIYGIHRKSN